MTPRPLADNLSPPDPTRLARSIKNWGYGLGLQQVGIGDVELSKHEAHLQRRLGADYHGKMDCIATHGGRHLRPAELIPGTLRVISLRTDYLPGDMHMAQILATPERTYVSRYTLGHDYCRLICKRLRQLAERIQTEVGPFGFRAFVDSAPVPGKAIAEQVGLGWIDRNTLVLNRRAGSYFFLGELFVNMPLLVDPAMGSEHCGRCSACLDICPTMAFVNLYRLDTRRCISYLTIEYKGAIPLELRSLIGNRVFDYDDCQIVCPWNRFARPTGQDDLQPRHNLDNTELAELFLWSGEKFLDRTESSPLRRTDYERWLCNPTVGLGNTPSAIPVLEVLKARCGFLSELAREHVEWALWRHGETQPSRRLPPGPDGSELDKVVAIVAQPGDRLADIVQRQVGATLLEAFAGLWRPTRGQLLEDGGVEVAVVGVAFQPGHVPIKEAAVLTDAVAADRRAAFGHPLLGEGQDLRLDPGHAYGTFPDPLGQAGLAVLAGIPLVHTGEDFLWLVDGDHRFFGQGVEVAVGDDGGHFDDDVPVRIEAGRLQVNLDKVLRVLHGESLQSLCRAFQHETPPRE